eukprot:scaffold3153_cov111-Isochrysis_galbana.AAC.3
MLQAQLDVMWRHRRTPHSCPRSSRHEARPRSLELSRRRSPPGCGHHLGSGRSQPMRALWQVRVAGGSPPRRSGALPPSSCLRRAHR